MGTMCYIHFVHIDGIKLGQGLYQYTLLFVGGHNIMLTYAIHFLSECP